MLGPSTGRTQVAEVELDEPSVVTVDYEVLPPSTKTDNVARTIVVTQVDESQRERELPSRGQGNAWPVPAGRTRIFVERTGLDPIRAQISIAPGVAVTEITPGEILIAPPLAVQTFRAPPYARQVRTVALVGSIDFQANGNTWTQIANSPSMSLWTPAFSTIGVFSAAGGTFAVSWQVTS